MKNRIPLWLAVAITVVVSLPFGMLLKSYNIALWASFIVWAQYFNYGANPKTAGRIIFPCTFLGVFWGMIGMALSTLILTLIPGLAVPNDSGLLGIALGLGLAVCLMVYFMGKSKLLGEGSLSYFNGLSLFLAMFFTGASGEVAGGLGVTNSYALIVVAAVWTLVSGYFGYLLAWFNILITFPKKA